MNKIEYEFIEHKDGSVYLFTFNKSGDAQHMIHYKNPKQGQLLKDMETLKKDRSVRTLEGLDLLDTQLSTKMIKTFYKCLIEEWDDITLIADTIETYPDNMKASSRKGFDIK